MSDTVSRSTPLPDQRQEVCPYEQLDSANQPEPMTMSRRGDYLHGQWFWQERHVQFIAPETLYDLADTQEPDTTSPDSGLTHEELHDWLCDLVQTLPKRDRKVMQIRYGLLDGKARTLEETGQRIGVSRERIRQIEARILHRLKRRLGVLPRRPLPPPLDQTTSMLIASANARRAGHSDDKSQTTSN